MHHVVCVVKIDHCTFKIYFFDNICTPLYILISYKKISQNVSPRVSPCIRGDEIIWLCYGNCFLGCTIWLVSLLVAYVLYFSVGIDKFLVAYHCMLHNPHCCFSAASKSQTFAYLDIVVKSVNFVSLESQLLSWLS